MKPATPGKPPHQRPELPDFWEHRFRSGCTPWEAAEAPPALRDFVRRHADMSPPAEPKPRVLVPGCGNAADAVFLDRCGWRVTALDFSAAAVERARVTLGDAWRGTLLCADFFALEDETPFDIVIERAFLCALPRARWPDYAQRMRALLRPGGLLAGCFYHSGEMRGPPFGLQPGQLAELLGAHFDCCEDRPITESLPVFAGGERWQVWVRR